MAEQEKTPDSFSAHWCTLDWTPWVPFNTTSRTLDAIPDKAGLYRVRAWGHDLMMYVGSTGGSLRQCFTGTRQNTARLNMPPDDPWPVAPALWAWKDAKGYSYEFSSVVYGNTIVEQRTAECYLTYLYRLERHESPLCNFGRFHRKYRRASEQVPGGKLGPNEPLNPAGGPSLSPLTVTGKPGEPGWMGLAWSPVRSLKTHTTSMVPPAQGYYLIFDATNSEMLMIGKAEDCAKALFEISKKPWDNLELSYSFFCEPKPLAVHNLRERENDLIGNYIEQFGTAPEYQFLDSG